MNRCDFQGGSSQKQQEERKTKKYIENKGVEEVFILFIFCFLIFLILKIFFVLLGQQNVAPLILSK